jgi:hypothetical protein
MEALLHSLVVQMAVAAAIFPAIVKIFSTVEETLSDKAKQKLTSFINRLDTSHIPIVEVPKTGLVFDTVFGPRHWSLFCVYRVALVAATSYVLVSLSVLVYEPTKYGHLDALKALAINLVLVNLPAEYLALWATRGFVSEKPTDEFKPSEKLPRLRNLVPFIGDCFAKVVYVTMFAAMSGLIQESRGLWLLGTFVDVWTAFHHPDMLVPLVSVFLSSLWIWVYIFVLHNSTQIYRAALALKWTLNFEKHPVRSLGLVTASLCSLLYFCTLFVARLFSSS